MNPILVLVLVIVLLFGAALITKRRFGLLGFALGAGSILSTIWGQNVGLWIVSLGIGIPDTLAQALVRAGIVLLPAVVVLFHGSHYRGILGKLIGALLFALLAAAFLIEPLGHVFVLRGNEAYIYAQLIYYRELIIGVGLVIALIDLALTKPPKPHIDNRSSKHH